MTLFNKKTELTKNIEELAVAQGRIQEVSKQLTDLQTIKNATSLEIQLTGNDSALEKRFKKLATAEEKAQKELQELQARQVELQTAITEEQERQRVERLKEASKADALEYAKYIKATMLTKELEKLASALEARNGGTFSPVSLRSELGLPYGARLTGEVEQLFEAEVTKLRDEVEEEVKKIVEKIRQTTGLDQ